MKAMLFDLGRVLIHYDHDRTIAGIASVSQASPQAIRLLLQSLAEPLGTGKLDARETHRLLMERAGVTPDFDRFVQAACQGMARDEEALAYAVSLEERPGVRVGIISNTVAVHAIWLHANLPELKRFSAVLLSNEVGLMKPDPRIYRLASQRLGIPPEGSFFVDDLPENVRGAQAVGMAGLVHESWARTRPAIEAWLAGQA